MDDSKFIAHSKNTLALEHDLSEHLREVARIMEDTVESEIYKKIFRVTGLLRDFGKYQTDYQKYLPEGGRRGSVPHASWGAGLRKKTNQIEAAFAINGHHRGLPDKVDLKTEIYQLDDIAHSLLILTSRIIFERLQSKARYSFLKNMNAENNYDFSMNKLCQ